MTSYLIDQYNSIIIPSDEVYTVAALELTQGDNVLVKAGGRIVHYGENNYGILSRGGGNLIEIDGYVEGGAAAVKVAPNSEGSSFNSVINIGQSGRVSGSVTGIELWNNSYTINNSGDIYAFHGDAINLTSTSATHSLTVVNTGLIMSGMEANAINSGRGSDVIINAGTIYGDIILNAGNDTYEGYSGTLHGTVDLGDGLDRAKGGEGSETFIGGRGDDRLDGGAGIDTAIFSGAWANYIVAKNSDGSFSVVDRRYEQDGFDTLKNIELLKFSDQTIDLRTFVSSSLPISPDVFLI